MRTATAAFCLGLWIMGTLAISMMATQNFFTIDRLLAAEVNPEFHVSVERLGTEEARVFLRHLSSELNRLYFQYWNYAQLPLAGVVLWLVFGLPDGARLSWTVGIMLLIVTALTVLVTPPIVAIGRGLDFVPRDPPPPELATFGILHAVYTSLEIGKAALGLWVVYQLCCRPRERKAFPG